MRVFLATAALTILSPFASAETAASTQDVYACATIETDAERLSCYDSAVGRLKAAEDAGEVATVTREEVEQVKKDSFGFSIPSLPKLALPKLGGGDNEGNYAKRGKRENEFAQKSRRDAGKRSGLAADRRRKRLH